jgi:RHS repeat-associated protein
VSRTQRLKSVVTTLNGSSGAAANGLELSISYREASASSADAYYLAGAQLTAFGDNIPGVSFDYQLLPANAVWQQLKNTPNGIPALGGLTTSNVAYQLGKSWDDAGNSVPALFLSKFSNGKFLSATYLYSANGWVETNGVRAPPVPFVGVAGNPLNVVLMDLNGDHKTDLLQLTNNGQAFIQNQHGWAMDASHSMLLSQWYDPNSELPLTLVQPLRLGSYTHPRQDLLVKLKTGSYSVILNKETGWVRPKSDPALNFSLSPGDELAIGDFNGDGLDDRVDLVSDGSSLSLVTYTSSPNSQTWTQQTSATWSWKAPITGPFHLRTIKIDPSDPCEALLISIYDSTKKQESLFVLQGSKNNGWIKQYSVKVPGPLFFENDGTVLSPILLDVNNDGRTDIIFDQIVQQTWLQSTVISGSTVTWTHDDGAYGPPPVLISKPSDAQNYIVAPWHGPTPGAVIIALPSSSQTKGATYLSNAAGWQNTSLSLTPSVSLVSTKQNTGSIQFVDLNGDGLQDVLYNDGQEIPCKAVSNVADPHCGAQFNWANKPWTIQNEFTPPLALEKTGDLGARATFVDVNGDGYLDLVYSYIGDGNPVNEIYLNGTPFSGCKGWAIADQNCDPPAWSLPQGVVLTDVTRGGLGCQFVDINGDGLPDLICGVLDSSGNITANAYINDGHGTWDKLPNYSLPAAFVFDAGTGPTLNLGTQLIDLDGDRLPALIAAYRNPLNPGLGCQKCGIYKNLGAGAFDPTSSGKFPVNPNSGLPIMLDAEYYPLPNDGYQISFMDIDGDGLPDMVQFTNGQAQVYLGNGTSWDPPLASWTITGDATNLNFGGTQFVDVNGDGRLDVIYNVQGGAAGVLLNTGNGWTPQGENSNLAPSLPFISSSGDDLGVRLIDVTGDGSPDQIQSNAQGQLAYENPGARDGMLSFVQESYGTKTSYSYRTLVDYGDDYHPITADKAAPLPGIPLVPFSPVVWQTVTDESYGRTLTTTYGYEGFRFDLLNSIALGFARTEHTDQAADTPSFSISHRTWYRQEPHLVGHPRLEQTIVNQNSKDVMVDETTKTWDERPVSVALNGAPTAGYLQLLLSKSVIKSFDLNGTGSIESNVEATFSYDDWLNATEVEVTKPGRATQTLDNEYVGVDFSRYGRLTKSTSTVMDSNGKTVSERSSTFEYFDDVSQPQRFLLKSEKIDVGDDQLNSTTVYTRDDRGDITSTTKSAVNYFRRERPSAHAMQLGGSARTERVEYDQQQLRQVILRSNAKQQNTSLSYLANSIGSSVALPTSSIDPNLLTTTNSYDGLGRTVTVTTPDKITHHFYRYQAQQIPAEWLVGINSIAKITAMTPTGPCSPAGRTLTWTPQPIGFAEEERVTTSVGASRLVDAKVYDVRNRLVRTINYRTADGSTARLAFTDSKYDTQGRLVGQSLPYFSGDAVYWTAYDYDALGRRTLARRPNGGVSQLCYNVTAQGLQKTLIDANRHATVIQLNLDGKPLQITRADGGILSLSYDAMGRVCAVKSPSGAKTTLEFDGLGNRKHINDPNAGSIEYRYDAFGQLREERSGSQQWVERDYDELGRKRHEWRWDQVTVWTYDKPGAIGHPDAVTLSTQASTTLVTYVENYDYDDYVRLRHTLTMLHAAPPDQKGRDTDFRGTYSFSYDPYSALDEVEYPTPQGSSGPLLKIRRHYDDDTGQLTQVDDITNSHPHHLWTLKSADASGHTLLASFGNGTSEAKSFDPNTGRIMSFEVASSAGKPMLSESYAYDPVGNLSSRLSDGRGLEVFSYDEENRLKRVDGSRKFVSTTYDSDDRIRTKSDVGEYHYFGDADSPKYCHSDSGSAPDALCAIQRHDETTDTFQYDEFGNLENHELHGLVGHAVAVEYTSDHHVASLAVGSRLHKRANAQFYYGPSGQRILSRERNDKRYKETVHIGLYDRISVYNSCIFSRRRQTTNRFYVLGDQGVFLTIDATNRGNGTAPGSRDLHTTSLYQHHDRLGSIVLLTKDDGRTGARVHYDPWGKSSGDLAPSRDDNSRLEIEAAWTQGFTGQDHIPDFDLIHMTGRVYDPRLGLFLSVDPLGEQNETGVDLNPYLYADGNPLAITDPTGFWGLSDIENAIGNAISGIGQAVGSILNTAASAVSSALQNAAQWVGQNWREVATVAVIAVVTFATAGTGTGPVVAAALAGAAGDATETALYGGSVQDVIGAAVEGGVFGAFSAGLGDAGLSWQASELVNGVAGGLQSAISGQNFTSGFVTGALSQVSAGSITAGYTSGWGMAEQVALNAVINGAVSEAQGGKFANGALTGVFQQLYLDVDQDQWQVKDVIEAANAFVSSGESQLGVNGFIGAVGVTQQSVVSTTLQLVPGYSDVGSFLSILQTGANDLTALDTVVQALKPKPVSVVPSGIAY